MIYQIENRQYNNQTGFIHAQETKVKLTNIQKKLLDYFLKHPNKIISKQTLVDEVWDTVVSTNSVNQVVVKLRSYLEQDSSNPKIIITHFGQGYSFELNLTKQEQKEIPNKNKQSTKPIKNILWALIFISLSLLTWKYMHKPTALSEDTAILIFVSTDDIQQNNQDWLNQASTSLFDELFSYQKNINLKNIEDKPKHQSDEQFIIKLWENIPKLKVIKTKITQTKNLYNISLTITDKLKSSKIQTFSNQSLSLAIKQASNWLSNNINNDQSNLIHIPDDSYITELYLHGLSSFAKNDFKKAENYFSICLKEKNDFHLARLKLADTYRKQGRLPKSLALLETLSTNNPNPLMLIEINAMRGDIYDTQGKYQQAKDLYIQTINKYQKKYPTPINPVRFNLSHTLSLLNEYQQALAQLSIIENKSKDIELLANVFQKESSILLSIGKTKQAKIAAEKSLELFEEQNDLLGKAKIYSNLARITTHQSKYKESLQYLNNALSISKGIDYKLGSGAILNEMIYLLLVQGKYTQAWQANLDMQKISQEIDYDAMLQISKQYAMDISRAQRKYKQAEIYLKQHLQLAQASDNKKALIRNKVLELDLLLDEHKLDKVLILINEIQDHIDQSKEVRLQPRLNKQLGRYYLLTQQDAKAIETLQLAKKQAKKTEDGETIIEINNLLAKHYIDTNQIQKASAELEQTQDNHPLPYPYLLLKSKINEKQGKYLTALDFANECKQSAYENWTQDDDIYLNHLKKEVNNQ